MFGRVTFVEDDFEQIWWPQERGPVAYLADSFDFRNATHYYRPVSNAFFALTAPLLQLNADGYHVSQYPTGASQSADRRDLPS
jgi:hypothetical protein